MKKMIPLEYDYTIIGAGPAGMAAAITAREHGLSVLILDEQHNAGGQIFRNIEGIEKTLNSEFRKLGDEYKSGWSLVKEFKKCGADYFSERSVWQIDKDLGIHHISTNSNSFSSSIPSYIKTKNLLIAVGAMERPMPLPGWTLPGVMACTAVDALYKTSGLVPDKDVILAGSGPLLLLIACRLLDAGVHISALLETNKRFAILKALPFLPQALRSFSYLKKGISMMQKIKNAGIPIYTGIKSIEALGKSKFEKVRFKNGTEFIELSAGMLLLHNGVVPNIQITRQLGCEHRWYELQRYWEPVVDDWGNTSLDGVSIAGDCGKISGSSISELTGNLAALDTVYKIGAISKVKRNQFSQPHRKELSYHKAVRPFLDKLFQPGKSWLIPEKKETIVCRCEEVTVNDIRQAISMGAQSPDRIKSLVRCGMGPCQARMCGLTVSEILADERNISPEEVGYLKIRSPIKPITLGKLAEID